MAKNNDTIEKLVDTLSKLTVLELSELKKALEEKWDVKAQAAVAAVAAPASAEKEDKKEEATEFNITLDKVPADKKIAVIKVVRAITGLGLKEAKDIVEGAPKLIKEHVSKAETEEIMKKLKEAGAEASQKGI